MQPDHSAVNRSHIQQIKHIFDESIRKSYFNGFKNDKNLAKSRIQTDQIILQEEVDEDTFRIIRKPPQRDSKLVFVYKTGRFYLQKDDRFLCCLSSRKRYEVQLKNFKLKVTNDHGKIERFFNFETEAGSVKNRGDYLQIEIYHCKQKFYFEPIESKQTEQIVQDWADQISRVIDKSGAKKKKYSYLQDRQEDFYKFQHVSHDEFAKNCNSLDLVLFKSQHSAARVQRFFTDSEYDHVAIVLRNRKNEIFLFESTSDQGVGLTPWKHMIRYEWYKSTDKIAWRKLNMTLSEYHINVIEAYVAKTLGKEFEISLNKILMLSSNLERTKEEEHKKTYFCSELVARLYKQLGLLDEGKSSTRYYPVDFSDKVSLQFQKKGVQLSNEIVIAFNR